MKIVNLKSFMMAIALPLAITFGSCGPKDNPPVVLPEITIEDGSSFDLSFGSDELTAKTVKIISNRDWTSEASADWVEVNPVSGPEGTHSVSIKMKSENTGTADRKATVIFKNNATKNAVLNITQAKSVAPPTTGLAEFSETFESGTAGSNVNIDGWILANPKGDRQWQVEAFNNNKHAQASAHTGTAPEYEYWLITPALDIDAAAVKSMSFETAAAYFKETSSLEVYVMDAGDPSAGKVKLEGIRIATADDNPSPYTPFIPSGEIDLNSYSGIKHIGFRYVAEGGVSNSTTYQLDNFVFGVEGMPLSLGEPALSGVFMKDTEIDGARISIPYQNAKGTESYTVSVAVSGPAAGGIDAITNQEVTLQAGNGNIVIDITGTPTTTGEFTLTLTGIEGLSNNVFNGTVQAQSTSPNLLLNPSFETYTEDVPDAWTTAGDAALTKITSGAKDGTLAVNLAGDGGTARLEQIIEDITPGAEYTVSFWYRNNTKGQSAQGIRIWSNFKKSDGSNITMESGSDLQKALQPSATFEAVTEWTQYSVTVTAPADAAQFLFGLRATNGQNGEYDNCSFRIVEE